MNDSFHKIANQISYAVGAPWTFIAALLLILAWAVSGAYFNYSNSWQIVINTGTTIITFLMVFLIQNTQNRDAKATQLKLDELIRAVKGARNSLVNIEDLSDEELEKLHKEFKKLHNHYFREFTRRKKSKRNRIQK